MKESFCPPWQGKDWMMMKVCFSTLTRQGLSQNRVQEKRRFGWRRQSTPEKFKTLLTKGKVSCSFPWIKVKVLSICLWSVFLGWTIGVCSVGGQVSISFLVLVLWSEVWILVCSSGHKASVTSFSETHRSLADRFCFAYSTIQVCRSCYFLLQRMTHFFICSINLIDWNTKAWQLSFFVYVRRCLVPLRGNREFPRGLFLTLLGGNVLDKDHSRPCPR